jgi:glyoxylase-like metal-dependent hydrolase (beta-lactamase superfamily II)
MEKPLSYGEDYKYIPATSLGSGTGSEIRPDLYCHTIQIVNICLVGTPGTEEFVLVDAGMPKSADSIIAVIEERFGSGSKPKAIVLTHAHFDHVGAIVDLLERWNDIPVYAHQLELPFLTGQKSYPQPDSSVEGGMVSKMSPMFPIEPIQLGNRVHSLPGDGTVPHMFGFRWIHTPGHTPGHVSFYRDQDGALIAGDAFVTVKQEYLYRVFTQEQEISGPPRYLTPDWQASWESVRKLEALKPSVAITGHGVPMEGETLTRNLEKLARNFDQIAIPDCGKYVN